MTHLLPFTAHVVFTAFLLEVVGRLVRGADVDGSRAVLAAALVLGLANSLVRPLLVLFTFPTTMLTLGPYLLVVNALGLWLVSAVVPDFRVRGLGSGFLAALMLTLLNLAIAMVLGGWEPDPQTDHHIRAPIHDRASSLLAGVAVRDEERIALVLAHEAAVASFGAREKPIQMLDEVSQAVDAIGRHGAPTENQYSSHHSYKEWS